MNDQENPIGRQLRRYREQHKLSKTALAQLLGISRSSVVQYETGVQKPPVAKIGSMAERMGVSSVWLLGMDETEPISFRTSDAVPVTSSDADWAAIAKNLSDALVMAEKNRQLEIERRYAVEEQRIAEVEGPQARAKELEQARLREENQRLAAQTERLLRIVEQNLREDRVSHPDRSADAQEQVSGD